MVRSFAPIALAVVSLVTVPACSKKDDASPSATATQAETTSGAPNARGGKGEHEADGGRGGHRPGEHGGEHEVK